MEMDGIHGEGYRRKGPGVMAIGLVFCMTTTGGAFQNLPVSHPIRSATEDPKGIVSIGPLVIDEAMVDAFFENRFGVRTQAQAPSFEAPSFEFRRQVLGMLVQQRLAFLRLLEIGGEPLAARIAEAEEKVVLDRQATGLPRALTPAERAQIGWEVSWNAYLRKQMTDENLEKFFQVRRVWFDGTEIMVSQIFVPHPTRDQKDDFESNGSELLAKIKERIKRHELSFSEAARRHSRSPSADFGGMIGWVGEPGDLPTEVLRAGLTSEAGALVGPLRSRLGWHLLFIHEKKEGRRRLQEIEDQGPFRRAAADFLFERLARDGAGKFHVRYLLPEWKIDERDLGRPATNEPFTGTN